jgi:hypothetical protein
MVTSPNVEGTNDLTNSSCGSGTPPWLYHFWEFRKNLSPSKRRVWRNSWNKFSGTLNLWRSGILNLRSPEVANLWRSGILNLRSPEVANLRRSGILNLRSPEVANLRRSESWTCKALKSRTCEDPEPESVKFRNLLKIKFGGYDAWRFLWIKDSRTS